MPTGTNGNDTLFGTIGPDDIFGLAGNDTIYGREGDDRLYGDDGRDILFGDLGSDILYGGDFNDELNGGGGDDFLIGGTLPNALPDIGFDVDTLNGGEGNDIIYITDNSTNTIDGGLGTDLLQFALNRNQVGITIALPNLWTLGQGSIGAGATVRGIEGIKDNIILATNGRDAILIGAGYTQGVVIRSYDGNDILGGGGGDDNIFAGIGNDNVGGSLGNDSLRGEEGDDRLEGENGNDIIACGIGNDVAEGGSGNDYLIGEGGDDQLNGGSGVNTLQGGTGNDIYIVSNRTDSVLEFAGEGLDEVRTTLGVYGLQANIESLFFSDNAAHGAGVGNVMDNLMRGGMGADGLFGREGNDTLRGGAGAANTLLGQAGDDIYIVEASGDSVIEFVNEGVDTVETALSAFALRSNVENLTYTGNGAFTGVGAEDANRITGGAGDDFLSGLDGNDVLIGKSGTDLMLGGNGADQFRYEGGETGLDRIIDFTSGTDKIALLGTAFTHTATIDFVSNGTPAATSTNSTFLYNVNNGIVSFDADGTGAGAAVAIAQLNAGLTLTPGDFIFY